MEERSYLDKVGDTIFDAKEYALLHLDKLKLRLLEKFAKLFNNIFAVFVIILLASFALVFFAAALTWALGLLIGSLFWAIVIMGGLFLTATILVYIFRKKLIINSMVSMLAEIMFDKDQEESL